MVYQRVPQQRPHLRRHHLHHRILYLTSADTPKIQYKKEVEVRVRNYGETRCIDQQKRKTHIQMKDTKKYRAIYCMTCRSGIRENLVDESSPLEPRGNPAPKDQDTSRSSHQLPMESRAKVEAGSGKHGVYTHFPKDPNCESSAQSERRDICGIVAVRSGQRMVGGFHGVSLLSAKLSRSCRMGRHRVEGGKTVWSNGRISPYFCERPIETTSIWSKSLTRYIPRSCIVCGRNLERRHHDRRHWWMQQSSTPEGSMQRKC